MATAADVREWAREKGIEVGRRGRLSAELVADFNKGRRGAARYTPNVAG